MRKYAAVRMKARPSVMKYFESASAAQKYRTKQYKIGYKGGIGILGTRGMVGPRTYGKMRSII